MASRERQERASSGAGFDYDGWLFPRLNWSNLLAATQSASQKRVGARAPRHGRVNKDVRSCPEGLKDDGHGDAWIRN